MPAEFQHRLGDLAADISEAHVVGDANTLIRSIAYDSRRATTGSLFVAMQGQYADGVRYVKDAVSRGAVAVASERPVPDSHVPNMIVPDARKALAELSWSFYGHPEQRLTLIGITGTNGKTTVATVLRQVLEASGSLSGIIGTLGVFFAGHEAEGARTTPEAVDIASSLAAMESAGVTYAAMEATSIGIDLERTWKLPFRATVFTNLTRDHLDYHKSWESYRAAKLRLFREQPADGYAILNADDPEFQTFAGSATSNVLTYGLSSSSDLRADSIQLHRNATSFALYYEEKSFDVSTPLIGQFNVHNVLAVIATAVSLGIPIDSCLSALRSANPARGRAEVVSSAAPFTILIDYAHTPDALEKILGTLQSLEHNRIITVVGAGGNRDRGKRPLMARAACKLSDVVILTSDNPRDEEPDSILDDMRAGVPSGAKCSRIADRRRAIASALESAGSGDIVLIAGKGHETYQEIRGQKYPFDDRLVAVEWLNEAGLLQ